MLNWMRHWLHKQDAREPSPVAPNPNPESGGEITRTAVGVTVDLDRIHPEARGQVYAELIRQNGVPWFAGAVEHAYNKTFLQTTARCPRCHAPTRLHCAHFIYATNVATRVMLAPAGFFCSVCPTVIIDEAIVEAGMKRGLEFRGVVGIDYANRKAPDYFRTLNGSKAVYILDEAQQIMGLAPLADVKPDSTDAGSSIGRASASPGNNRQKRRRQQMARQSRKRNRRH